jgi:DNA-binding beta-propeller fold protein YncE
MQNREWTGTRRGALLLAGALVAGGCGDDLDGTASSGGAGGGGGGGSSLQAEYPLLGADLFPEGAAFDPDGQSFFVGSLAHGTVTQVTASGEESLFYAGETGAPRATLGLEIDVARRRLWSCAIDPATFAGWIWVFSLDTGERTHEIVLEDVFSGASCNDMALDPAGRAYVTDRENPNVYLIDVDAPESRIWATGPLLEATVGLNGIAITADGSAALANTYLPARLVRISMVDPSVITEVALTGDPFEGTGSLAGADGSTLLSSALYVAFPNELMEVVPADAEWMTATVRSAPAGPGLTALTVANGDMYGSNGQSVAFLSGQDPEPFVIRRLELLSGAP